MGEVRSYEYNESYKVTRITDFDGNVMIRTYNWPNCSEILTNQLIQEANRGETCQILRVE